MTIIVAIDKERGIGRDNDLMWDLPDDMQFFKDSTKGHIVIMGRKNYDSIPEKYRPLPGRENVILTRTKNFAAKNCVVLNSIEECVEYYKNETERQLFIIGGGQIYKLALDSGLVNEMYITHINHVYGADTFFPEFDLSEWNVQTISEHVVDERHEASFTILKYSRK